MASDASSPSSSDTPDIPQILKRKVTAAGLNSNGTRSVKRRASRACQCCRSRKVRCNVVEHGPPCTNCRLDEVECIVSENRRRKKWQKAEDSHETPSCVHDEKEASSAVPNTCASLPPSRTSSGLSAKKLSEKHVPHSLYQYLGQKQADNTARRLSNASASPVAWGYPVPNARQSPQLFNPFTPTQPKPVHLPYYIKPIPQRIGTDEIAYLQRKGALAIPDTAFRNELLKAFVEYVYPYMPLVDLNDFLMIVEQGDGSLGRISLLLFQAVMFVGTAFVDEVYVQRAGYASRKEARKDFFQKARLLYDFDYEIDRISLVQSLLLMTYWYETPDDQKDTWHWMGVAISLSHTIGLHRDPERSSMEPKRKKLWKRIYWSCYMRDRLIALGMRRPTRIKNEDYDVPMLKLSDFDLAALPDSVTCIPQSCRLARDVHLQRQMALMCIEKAKLCLCVSHVLSANYSILNNNHGILSEEGNTRTTMMLLPKKLGPETCELRVCDEELQRWITDLPEEARFRADHSSGYAPLDLNISLLHMIYYTTLSALHRPQVLPSNPGAWGPGGRQGRDSPGLLEESRRKVRLAAHRITAIAQQLYIQDLVRFLPTTGVTVLLPAIIIHLLDIKAPDEDLRRMSLRGFCQCMQVMTKLREIYAAADFSTAFLEAAIRKAGIQAATPPLSSDLAPNGKRFSTTEDLVAAGQKLNILAEPAPAPAVPVTTLTPPPDYSESPPEAVTDAELSSRLQTFLASTPPISDSQTDASISGTTLFDDHMHATAIDDFEQNFDSLIDMDATPNFLDTDGAMQGESSGFTFDMDWMTGFGEGAEKDSGLFGLDMGVTADTVGVLA